MEIRRRQPNPAVKVSNLSYQIKVPDSEPHNILEKIVWHKEKEIEKMRERLPLIKLRQQVKNTPPPMDFIAALRNSKLKPALIAEVKQASPSKGIIRADFDAAKIAKSYQENNATCLSVLTDTEFFQGSFDNLSNVRKTVDLPLLCKEFIIYPYQIYLARANGADAVLSIAAILNDRDLAYFVKIINSLEMTALVEVHTLAELDRVLAIEGVSLIGINNRNLEDFSVNLETTCRLLQLRKDRLEEKGILIVSESGLHRAKDLEKVKKAGADAVLIGESLVKQPDPGKAIGLLYSN